MGVLAPPFSPPLNLNEGFFLILPLCWWGVSGSGKNEDFLERAFKSLSLSLSLALSQFFAMPLPHPKWGQASSKDLLLSKTPKSSAPPPALSTPPSTTFSSSFLLLPFPFLLNRCLSLTSPSCQINGKIDTVGINQSVHLSINNSNIICLSLLFIAWKILTIVVVANLVEK